MKDISPRVLFGSIIAYVLLVLYVYVLREAIVLAQSVPEAGASLPELNPGISRTMATVGGLVSALVIAQLAIKEPGEGLELLFSKDADWGERLKVWLSLIYVLTWIGAGAFAFIVGELQVPGKVPELTNFAQAWLGLAVAAGYSYFGLKEPST
jgi:hypothetical protein